LRSSWLAPIEAVEDIAIKRWTMSSGFVLLGELDCGMGRSMLRSSRGRGLNHLGRGAFMRLCDIAEMIVIHLMVTVPLAYWLAQVL
jgi:hypothetical protein